MPFVMSSVDSLTLENWFRSIAGECERGDYGIDSDQIRCGLAQWCYCNQKQLPKSVHDNPVMRIWEGTLLGVGVSNGELGEDQLESFLEEVRKSRASERRRALAN